MGKKYVSGDRSVHPVLLWQFVPPVKKRIGPVGYLSCNYDSYKVITSKVIMWFRIK